MSALEQLVLSLFLCERNEYVAFRTLDQTLKIYTCAGMKKVAKAIKTQGHAL